MDENNGLFGVALIKIRHDVKRMLTKDRFEKSN